MGATRLKRSLLIFVTPLTKKDKVWTWWCSKSLNSAYNSKNVDSQKRPFQFEGNENETSERIGSCHRVMWPFTSKAFTAPNRLSFVRNPIPTKMCPWPHRVFFKRHRRKSIIADPSTLLVEFLGYLQIFKARWSGPLHDKTWNTCLELQKPGMRKWFHASFQQNTISPITFLLWESSLQLEASACTGYNIFRM